MKEQSQRQLRVAQLFRHELVKLLQHGGFTNPALHDSGSITVTEVSMSPDLKNAKAYVLKLGEDSIGKETLDALNQIAPKIQGELARQSNMRVTPRLRFEEDAAFANAQRLNAVLAGITHSE